MSNFFDSDLQSTEFSVAMRGYDRAQVDAYAQQVLNAMKTAKQHRIEAERRLDDVRTKLRRTEERIAGLERRLADSDAALAETERPTLAGLGARVEKLLRAAELEADDQREDARRQAADIRARALAEAAETAESARMEAHSVTGAAERDAAETRTTAANEAQELRTNARRDHDLKRADATRESEQIRGVAH
ncbi:MAG TPA: DivIVA domain-containing protein, partial [Phytomonospora sp.]